MPSGSLSVSLRAVLFFFLHGLLFLHFLCGFLSFELCACSCSYLTSFVVPNVLRLRVIVILKDQTAKDKALQHMAAMSSAQIVSATAIHNKLGLPGIPRPTFPGAPGVSC